MQIQDSKSKNSGQRSKIRTQIYDRRSKFRTKLRDKRNPDLWASPIHCNLILKEPALAASLLGNVLTRKDGHDEEKLGGNMVMVVSVMTDNDKVEATEFDEAILSCVYNLQRNSKHRLEWKKIERGSGDVSFVYYEGDIVGLLKGRAEMFDSSIRIKNVTRKDSAVYRCEVTTAAGYLEEVEVDLTVLVLPATPKCDVPRNVMTGTVVELKCRENEGFPASQYDWYKDGERLKVQAQTVKVKTSPGSYTININSGTLQFNTVAKTDTGEYYCEAYNRVGRSQKCLAKKMQVDDLNVGGIVAAAVVVSLVIALCGLGVFHAHKKGYFSRGHSSQKTRSVYKPAPSAQNEFKHTKSFVI